MVKDALHSFLSTVEQAVKNGAFIKMTLSGYRGSDADLQKILVREVLIKQKHNLSFTYRYKTRDIVKNFLPSDALKKTKEYLSHDFSSAVLFCKDFDLSYPSLKKSKPTQTKTDDLSHDRKKTRHVETNGKKYLQDLKITDVKGEVLKSSYDKYRQIDKYIKIISGLLKDMDPTSVRTIVDMGSGKGYLTFALYDYLTSVLKLSPVITGVEYRKDMVDLCNHIAAQSNFKGLSFAQGAIDAWDKTDVDMLIALHACDTATDDAIRKGVRAGAKIIVVAPCCHKQVRKEMESKGNRDDIIRHGIFMERMAEMVTDSLRALYLEYCGYDVKVFEFISGEHTAKNVMIVGTLSSKPSKRDDVRCRIQTIKDQFGVTKHPLDAVL